MESENSMTDPISIAGGALGAISLSIQVCQGLVSYYDSWKSYEETLFHNDIRLAELEISLEMLKNSLTKLDPANDVATQHVNKTIMSCRDGMEELKKVLDKCRLVQVPKGFTKQPKDHGRKAVFPFKKDTLNTLKLTVTELQGNVDSAMQVLQLYVYPHYNFSLSAVAKFHCQRRAGQSWSSAELGGFEFLGDSNGDPRSPYQATIHGRTDPNLHSGLTSCAKGDKQDRSKYR